MRQYDSKERIAIALCAGNVAKAALMLSDVNDEIFAKVMLRAVGEAFEQLVEHVERKPEQLKRAPAR